MRASTPGQQPSCRRRHNRWEVRLEVRIARPGEGEALSAHCVNISLGGMLLSAQHQLSAGTDVRIWLDLPETGELFMTGKVIWTDGANVGLQHELLGSGDTVTLSEYLTSLT